MCNVRIQWWHCPRKIQQHPVVPFPLPFTSVVLPLAVLLKQILYNWASTTPTQCFKWTKHHTKCITFVLTSFPVNKELIIPTLSVCLSFMLLCLQILKKICLLTVTAAYHLKTPSLSILHCWYYIQSMCLHIKAVSWRYAAYLFYILSGVHQNNVIQLHSTKNYPPLRASQFWVPIGVTYTHLTPATLCNLSAFSTTLTFGGLEVGAVAHLIQVFHCIVNYLMP